MTPPVKPLRITPGPNSLLLSKKRARPVDAEHFEQARLFAWRRQNEDRIPELAALYAIPNFAGFHGTKRARIRSGARAKAEGRRKGMLDTCLPVARGGFHALYVELKADGGRPSSDQLEWQERLRSHGNAAEIVEGWEAARDVILTYLNLPHAHD